MSPLNTQYIIIRVDLVIVDKKIKKNSKQTDFCFLCGISNFLCLNELKAESKAK